VDSRRAEAFSDGVFAVAITVLVFNLLAIGSHGLGARPYHVLLSAWPSYFAYVVSFLTIGIMWMNHHTMFAQISRVNRVVLVLNLILLMGVVAIPFPTALVAEQLKAMSAAAGHADAAAAGGRAAAVAYGLVMVAISVGYALTWLYLAAHQDILGATRRIRTPRASTLRFTAGLGGYVAATLVAAFVSAVAALAIYGLLAIYYLFEHLPDPSRDADEAGPGFGDAPGMHATPRPGG
jgi:TMEM175 potassium channel family protein